MKFGSFSIILDKNEYKHLGFKFDSLENILMKITQINSCQDGEINNIDFLTKTNDYVLKIYKYTKININIDKKILEYLKNGIEKQDIEEIFQLNLEKEKFIGYFIEDLGKIDLFDSLTHIIENKTNIWSDNTPTHLNEFITQMCEALQYLEQNKICHFDIKPENIMYNDNESISFGKRFKLIDFGFAETYPFSSYIKKARGTPIYAPQHSSTKYPEWALELYPNDRLYNSNIKSSVHYVIHYDASIDLLYKTDIYSMGVVFNQLLFYITKYIGDSKYDTIKILIKKMTDINIVTRYTSRDCINYMETDIETFICGIKCCISFN